MSKKSQVLENRGDKDNAYTFNILLPNGTSIPLTFRNPVPNMPLRDFIRRMEEQYNLTSRDTCSRKRKREINWDGDSLFLEDAKDRKIRGLVNFKNFNPHECHILRLHDGLPESSDIFKNMWDLTPVTDILKELPEEYTPESALADLIDNSLQAVWENDSRHVKRISVDVAADVISIFDTGPGMDGSDENSIVKWGKMGASLHRSVKGRGIGGKPPYLTPYFGMFGYGGPIASMYLGRHVLVSSKTMDSMKVYTLHLDREDLLRRSGSGSNWKTDGGLRDPLKDEINKTPHGSFTEVEIFKPNMVLDIPQLQCKLKDIYFPYIQCDEDSKSGKTIRPVNFEVNGVDLAEIEGGEVAITNLHSCNDDGFVLQLHLSCKQNSMTKSPDSKAYNEANARLKCVYFPMVEGKENIERILEKLESEGCRTSENFETYSRVSIRRLGRLLPDARWDWLPFMDLRQKKGDKADLFKRCCLRVKCFIETDAGFNPTPSKNDLARHSPFTTALRNFGNQPLENGKDIKVEIYRDGKQLNLPQLKREYETWILKMHNHDDTAECGEDQPVLVVSPINKKALRISSDVARVHKSLKRKGITWQCGQKIKLFKGACAGVHKANVYATIEYFLLEGLEGDSGVEARIICRPLTLSEEKGCILSINGGDTSLDIRDSLSVPVIVIDSGKCVAVESVDWDRQLEKQREKYSIIDLLDAEQCQELEVDGALPVEAPAGKVPPEVVLAVVRPASYVSSCTSKTLDQKYIARTKLEMSMQINIKSEEDGLENVRDISASVLPKPLKGIHGLYIFHLKSKYPDLFQSAGVYTFSFQLDDSNCKAIEKRVLIKRAPRAGYKNIQSACRNGEVTLLEESSHLPQAENLKARVMEPPKVKCEEIVVPSSRGKVLPFQDSSSIKQVEKVPAIRTPKVEYDEGHFPCPNGKLLNGEKLKKLDNEIEQIGLRIGELEKALYALKEKKKATETALSDLQESYKICQLSNSKYCSMKEELINCIESMNHTAASTVCNLSKVAFQESNSHFMGDVIGLVALLCRVRSSELSRILSEYLGEDQMLAVVCRSFAAARALGMYEPGGEVDSRHALHEQAAVLGNSISGRFLVIGIEDVSPYTGDYNGADPQRKLALPDPIWPSGNTPDGFTGYAVNMVDLDEHHLHTRTAAGHGLRETLFYCLFGELHVYQTREDMLAAQACIKHGAVSLDGGILKKPGVISLGKYRNPEICFPVLTSSVSVDVVRKKIEVHETAKSALIVAIEDTTKDHEKSLKRFHKKRNKCYKLMDTIDQSPVHTKNSKAAAQMTTEEPIC